MLITEKHLRKIVRNILKETTAFHGSANKFDKFETCYMGSGFGDQFYGWGIYVAANPSTALWFMNNAAYKKTQRSPSSKYDQTAIEEFKEKIFEPFIDEMMTAFKKLKYYGVDIYTELCNTYFNETWGYLKHLDDRVLNKVLMDVGNKIRIYKKENGLRSNEYLDNVNNVLDYFYYKTAEIVKMCDEFADTTEIPSDKGYLYTVRIPTDDGTNYVGQREWMRFRDFVNLIKSKFGEQTEFIKKLTNRASYGSSDFFNPTPPPGKLGGQFFYDALSDILGSNKKASLFLHRLGFLGYHYATGEEGECYVMFSGKDIEIMWRDDANQLDGYDLEGKLNISNPYTCTDPDIDDEVPDDDIATYKPKLRKLYNNAKDYYGKD